MNIYIQYIFNGILQMMAVIRGVGFAVMILATMEAEMISRLNNFRTTENLLPKTNLELKIEVLDLLLLSILYIEIHSTYYISLSSGFVVLWYCVAFPTEKIPRPAVESASCRLS